MNYLTIREVARICRVTPQTIKRWHERGRLVGFFGYESQKLLFRVDALKSFLWGTDMRYPKQFDPSGFDCIELGC